MKCETCGNEMVWKGSFLTGDLVCEYCEDDDDLCAELHMQDGSTIKVPHNGQVIIEVYGGGGGGGIGGANPAPAGGGGGGSIFGSCGDPDCDGCGLVNKTINVKTERLPDGRIIRTPIIEPTRTTPYHNCEAAQKYMEYRRAELLRLREEEMLRYCMVDTTPFLSEQLKEQLRIDEVCFNLDLKGKFV